MDLNTIWGGMSGNWRRKIKKAEKANLTIEANKHYNEFYEMYRRSQYTRGIYNLLNSNYPNSKTMKSLGTLFTAATGKELLIGILYLEDMDHIVAYAQGSNRFVLAKEKAKLINCANCLLHWNAIKYAKAKGIKTYDWGGLCIKGYIDNYKNCEPKNIFKLGGGGKPVFLDMYTRIYSPLYKLGKSAHDLIWRRDCPNHCVPYAPF